QDTGASEVNSSWLRILNLAESLDKLDLLQDEIAAAVKRMPGWDGGRVMSAMIDLRQGRIEAGNAVLQKLVPTISKANANTLAEVSQELKDYEPCIDLAIRCIESSTYFHDQDPSHPLIKLYEKRGRKQD